MKDSLCLNHKLWLFFVASLLSQTPNISCCIEAERLALLELKAYIIKPYADYALLPTWSDDPEKHNCCAWYGVRCNTLGRVTELNLNNTFPWNVPAQMVNMTLFRPFAQLIRLDLSHNGIYDLIETEELPKLRELQVIDLSYNLLSRVPIKEFCSVMNLQELHFRGNSINGTDLSCLGNLTSLKILDLSFTNINGELPSLENLTNLQYLDLSDNMLEGIFHLNSLANLSNLKYLQLSRNRLQVQTEDSSWQPTFQLEFIGLGNCSLNKPSGTFPKFLSHQHNLSGIDLSNNDLVGEFPTWLLRNNSRLQALYLMNNRLTGYLSLPRQANYSLDSLGISANYFHGKIPDNIGYVFPQMGYLNLSSNLFEGHIPSSVGHMKGLKILDLSRNNFSGEVPTQLLSCEEMGFLLLSDNNFEGDIIPENMNFTELSWLKLSNNSFHGTISDALLRSSTYLGYLDISNNKVTGQLPGWIGQLKGLTTLSMSGNLLQGKIPEEVCNLSQLNYLDISQNNFTGSIPSCSNFPNLYYMHLHDNRFTGRIPYGLSNFSSLESLDLRNNQLSDSIPLWINELSELTMLLLGGNNLHGQVPEQICELGDLNLLDLSRNELEGEIPSCLGNMSFGKISVESYFMINSYLWGNTIFEDFRNFPNYPMDIEVTFLAKNQFLSYTGGNLHLMSGLDVSCNKFTGVIPSELGSLVHVHSLNLSHNFIHGSIPRTFSNLKQMESLDLSSNHLSGAIPSELVQLNFLEVFNVSYNNLTGRTIETGQFSSFDQTSYLGNPGLCGSALNKSCKPESEVPPPSIPVKGGGGGDGGDGLFDMVDFFWSFSMSCGTIFLATILVLYINPQWRGLWFEFVDCHILSRFPVINKLSLY